MANITIRTKELLPHQAYMAENCARFNVACGGRRSGKSAFIEHLVYRQPGYNVLEGNLVALFGISRNTMTELWNELLRTGASLVKVKDGVNRRLDFHGGGVLEFWSLENYDVSRGRKYKMTIVDEAAIHANFGTAWEEVLRAHLVDMRGSAWFLSTPKGCANKFYDLFQNGVNGVSGWRSFKFPTSVNPLISPDEIEEARQLLPAHIFAQEFLADFVTDDLSVWLYAFDESKHVKGGVEVMRGYPIYVAVDFNNDPLEATVWQMSPQLGGANSFIHCIDSFSVKSKVDVLGRMIRDKYRGSVIYLCGDASGQNADVGRHQTLYQVMAGAMGLSRRQVILNKKNLTHSDSRLLCNLVLQNHPNFFISRERCGELVRQMMIAGVDVDSTTPGKLLKDRARFKLDMFDSYRYFMQTFLLSFAQKKYMRNLRNAQATG